MSSTPSRPSRRTARSRQRAQRRVSSLPPFDLSEQRSERRVAPTVAAGLLAVCVLGALALINGMANMRADEQAQLDDRIRLVEGLAGWASVSDDPGLLIGAIARSGLDPNSPQLNLLSLRAFQITPGGDATRLVALLDRRGRTLAAIPETGVPASVPAVPAADTAADTAADPTPDAISTYQLGDAWETAWSGRGAMSQVFTLDDRPARALVAPVGSGPPWAVLVVVSDESAIARLANGVGSNLLDMTDGSIATIDKTGTAILSSDPRMVGRIVVDPNEAVRSAEQPTRVWTSGEGSDEITFVAVAQPTTGYTTIFQQRTETLHADVRAQHRQRGLTVIAVVVGAVLSTAGFGFAREQGARRARTRLHTLLSSAHDVIVVVGTDGVTTFVSPAVRHLLGHEPNTFRGRPLTDLAHPGDVPRVQRLLLGPAARNTALNVRLRSGTGDYHWFDLATSGSADHPGFAGVVVTCHEVGKRKSLQDQLGRQAGHDALTGLPNRKTFRAKVEEALLENSSSMPVAVLFVDLDRFKPVNDTFGHEVGDMVLRAVASRLDNAVGDRGVASRFGGDEFGVVAAVDDVRAARLLADRVIRFVQRPVVVDGRRLSVDASVGVAISGSYYRDSEDLLRAADQAMYAAKRAGHGRYALAGSTGLYLDDDLVELAPRQPHWPGPGGGGANSGGNGDGGRVSRGADGGNGAGGGNSSAGARGYASATANEHSSDVGHVTAGPVAAGGTTRLSRRAVGGGTRRRLGRAAPPLAVGAILLATTVGGLLFEAAAREDARSERMAERKRLTSWVADYAGAVSSPDRMVAPASQLPWTFDGSETDQLILRGFAESTVAGDNAVVALFTPDGRLISSYPPGVIVPFGPGDEVWDTALTGRGANAPLVYDRDVVRLYTLAPVMRDSRPVALMLLGQSVVETPAVVLLSSLGSLGFSNGGLSVLDVHGRAAYSWDADQLGKRLVAAQDLAALPAGEATEVALAADYDLQRPPSVTLAVPITVLPNGGYALIEQPTSVFYAGIQSSHRMRDSMLIAITGVTLLGLSSSNRRRADALRDSEAYLRMLLHHAHDTVAVLDRDNRATFVSSAVKHLLGHEADDLVGRDVAELVHPEDTVRLVRSTSELVNAAASGGGGGGSGSTVHVEDVRMRTADGGYRWFDVDVADLRAEPAVRGLLLTCHEISERKALQDELRRQATHDPLTGLPNRAALTLNLAGRDPQGELCVLLVDLDDFKPVNDTLGHAAGDEVLRVVAGRLRQACQDGDAVFRLGGDEFVLVTPHGEQFAEVLAERVRALVRTPVDVAGTAVVVDATIGIAVASADSDRPDAVVRDADLAMYEAKRAGRGRHQVYARERSRSGMPQRF